MAESDYRTPAVKHMVMWGMAGVGKTRLAQALTLDAELNDYYRNGVLWVTLGSEWSEKKNKVEPCRVVPAAWPAG